MNQITQVPETVTNGGYEFDYSVWTQDTVITLCNVRWNSDYRDVWKADNQAQLDEYITNNAGPKIVVNQMMYLKPGEPVRINVPHNVANRYNYIRVTNPTMPINGDIPRTYYYFINRVEMLTPGVTMLHLQLDVWQQYVYETILGSCYIERGHYGIANANGMAD